MSYHPTPDFWVGKWQTSGFQLIGQHDHCKWFQTVSSCSRTIQASSQGCMTSGGSRSWRPVWMAVRHGAKFAGVISWTKGLQRSLAEFLDDYLRNHDMLWYVVNDFWYVLFRNLGLQRRLMESYHIRHFFLLLSHLLHIYHALWRCKFIIFHWSMQSRFSLAEARSGVVAPSSATGLARVVSSLGRQVGIFSSKVVDLGWTWDEFKNLTCWIGYMMIYDSTFYNRHICF